MGSRPTAGLDVFINRREQNVREDALKGFHCLFLGAICTALFTVFGSLAADAMSVDNDRILYTPDDDSPKEAEDDNPILADIHRRYIENGETKVCISARAIRNTRVIDDSRIFFERNSRRGFINRLNRPCRGLAREDRFVYEVQGGSQLCRGTIITVLDNFGRAWGSCSLGDFEELIAVDGVDSGSEEPEKASTVNGSDLRP